MRMPGISDIVMNLKRNKMIVEDYIDSIRESQCIHENIVIVTETPTNGKLFETPKKYVICGDCRSRLPIKRITVKNINVPLTKF